LISSGVLVAQSNNLPTRIWRGRRRVFVDGKTMRAA
jgi:hypothetical protein